MSSFWKILEDEVIRKNLVEILPLLKQWVTLASIYTLPQGFYFPLRSADALYVEVWGGRVKCGLITHFPVNFIKNL